MKTSKAMYVAALVRRCKRMADGCTHDGQRQTTLKYVNLVRLHIAGFSLPPRFAHAVLDDLNEIDFALMVG